MRLHLEFTTEPFTLDGVPRHVLAAAETARALGLETEMGPFGTAVSGGAEELLAAVPEVLRAALAAGARRISAQLTVVDDPAARDGGAR